MQKLIIREINMEKIRKGSKEDGEYIHQKLDEFNRSKVPFNKEKMWEDFSLFVTNEDEKIIGGITASLIMNSCLSIHAFWIDEKYRYKKIGTRLLKTLENEAKKEGAQLVNLDTFDFQALEFYKKNGYEVFGVLEEVPCKGHKRYYMKKKL